MARHSQPHRGRQSGARAHGGSPGTWEALSLPPPRNGWGTRHKMELVRNADFATREQARTALFDIEVFYNRQRRHSSLLSQPSRL